MPRSRAPVSGSQPSAGSRNRPREWREPVDTGRRLAHDPSPRINADGAAISQAAFNTKTGCPPTFPGTVLTTMIDRGIYPDPDYGLNNLAIPET